MSEQLSLLDAPPRLPVRRDDPPTSLLAAKSLNLKERKREVLEAMTRLAGTATASQIQADLAAHGIMRESGAIRSRLNQLKADGLTRKVGVRVVPPPSGTGRAETTWGLR